MLDFSKIEAGRLDLRPEPTDLEALLQEIAELLAGRAHVKGIDIAAEIGRDVPPRSMVDPARLRQVLINLAGNGVKFTEAGGVTLSRRAAPPTAARHRLRRLRQRPRHRRRATPSACSTSSSRSTRRSAAAMAAPASASPSRGGSCAAWAAT